MMHSLLCFFSFCFQMSQSDTVPTKQKISKSQEFKSSIQMPSCWNSNVCDKTRTTNFVSCLARRPAVQVLAKYSLVAFQLKFHCLSFFVTTCRLLSISSCCVPVSNIHLAMLQLKDHYYRHITMET